MQFIKNKKYLAIILSVSVIVISVYCMFAAVAKYTSTDDLKSSVQVSLLLQGDEADLYESPVEVNEDGSYETEEVNKKEDDNGKHEDGEPSRENKYEYVMPGVNIPKDPKIFITKKSGSSAYLYLEVLEENFPGNYTNNGFVGFEETDKTNNIHGTDAVYYKLKNYWEPVMDGEKQLIGPNGGNIFVYKNDHKNFEQYQVDFNESVDGFDATYLASYIMKKENLDGTGIKMSKYYGLNEVKDSESEYPYFEILEDDKVYISEKYVHYEYYSNDLNPTPITGSDYNFGLYFYGYMASAKLDGNFVTPLQAYMSCKNEFLDEAEYKAAYNKEHSINNN